MATRVHDKGTPLLTTSCLLVQTPHIGHHELGRLSVRLRLCSSSLLHHTRVSIGQIVFIILAIIGPQFFSSPPPGPRGYPLSGDTLRGDGQSIGRGGGERDTGGGEGETGGGGGEEFVSGDRRDGDGVILLEQRVTRLCRRRNNYILFS